MGLVVHVCAHQGAHKKILLYFDLAPFNTINKNLAESVQFMVGLLLIEI
jgi:hypothetical protein